MNNEMRFNQISLEFQDPDVPNTWEGGETETEDGLQSTHRPRVGCFLAS